MYLDVCILVWFNFRRIKMTIMMMIMIIILIIIIIMIIIFFISRG